MTSDTSTDASIGSSKTTLAMLGHSSVMGRWIDTQTPFLSEFPIGVDSLVRQCFKHEPPMPIELEHAIEITEDTVMPLAIRYAGDTELVLQGLGPEKPDSLPRNAKQGASVSQRNEVSK
jgi:hypothetical protein